MRSFRSAEEMLTMIIENEGNIGYCIGITEKSKKNWLLCLYIGSDLLLCLYDRTIGINLSAFDDLLNMKTIHKEALKNKTWKANDVKSFCDFVQKDYQFMCYELNIIDICIDKQLEIKNLVAIIKSNLLEIHQIQEGDVIVFERSFYTHHATFSDSSYMTVIHKYGEPEQPTSFNIASKSMLGTPTEKACVREDFVIEVAGYRRLYKGNFLYDTKHKPRNNEEILENCKKRLGETGYSILNDNCQNFVSANRNGISRSPEAESALKMLFLNASFVIGAVSALWLFKKDKKNNESEE